MRALRSFTIRPRLPEALTPLRDLAMNLRWSWDEPTRDLFRSVDPEVWEATAHDPVRLLGMVSPARFAELEADASFRQSLASTRADLQAYLDGPRWFQQRDGSPLGTVAYFSPEFGIAESLPQYSGGLGILAGDHLKAASDLGLPLVGVGLFYRHGYFRQRLAADGWQQEQFPDQDPWSLALTPCEDIQVEVDLGGRTMVARVWRADVGRIPLYLLDTDVDVNPPDLRDVTDRLYGGDVEHRLRQEILLGIGGVRALKALGIDAQVFHTNEGHAGFLGLERVRQVVEQGLSFAEAVESVRAGSVFTTHTPVPAGIDRFPRDLMETYFGAWASACGISIDQLMALGHRPGEPGGEPFNMAVMGLRLAARSNAVSALHGQVSREMFADLWPDLPIDDVPITSVTNGVHAGTWVSADVAQLLHRRVDEHWDHASASAWARAREIPDTELLAVKEQARARLVTFVRDRLRQRALADGQTASEAQWVDTILDPHALTIGFARRFATYKRATLLLAQSDRLQRLLLDRDRPVQFVFAGKAHPADDAGKAMIRDIVAYARELGVRHRFVFLDDYDISVARTLYQGADIWLNTPRRPHEACGTSGEKAALNGTLNCSILDGWWDEMFDGTNGWAIASADQIDDVDERDRLEAESLFDLLEHQIVPLFHDQRASGAPTAWLDRVRANLATLGPQVVAARMVRDYVTELYEPTASAALALGADNHARARSLAGWKAHVLAHWDAVHITAVTADEETADLGAERAVTVYVDPDGLAAHDLDVQLVHGTVLHHGELDHPDSVPLLCVDPEARPLVYRGAVPCAAPGRYGFAVRAVPANPDLLQPLEMGRLTWAGTSDET